MVKKLYMVTFFPHIQQRRKEMLADLCPEVLFAIFLLIDPRALLKCRSVCRRVAGSVEDEFLWRKRIQRFSLSQTLIIPETSNLVSTGRQFNLWFYYASEEAKAEATEKFLSAQLQPNGVALVHGTIAAGTIGDEEVALDKYALTDKTRAHLFS